MNRGRKVPEKRRRLQEYPTFHNHKRCLILACQQRPDCIFIGLKVVSSTSGVQPGASRESAECIGVLQEGIIGWGGRGEPMEACCVLHILIGWLSEALR